MKCHSEECVYTTQEMHGNIQISRAIMLSKYAVQSCFDIEW